MFLAVVKLRHCVMSAAPIFDAMKDLTRNLRQNTHGQWQRLTSGQGTIGMTFLSIQWSAAMISQYSQ